MCLFFHKIICKDVEILLFLEKHMKLVFINWSFFNIYKYKTQKLKMLEIEK